jgi:microcystin-dependent protein
MSTIFPEDPEVNEEYNGYRWNGVAWQIVGIDLTQEYPVITNGTISDSAVPATVARTESPEFTGIVVLPQNTSIGDISHTEIMSLAGASGSIQAQINTKADIDSQTFTGTVALPSTTSIGDVSSAEISYLHGVSGSIQVQIDGKTTASYVDEAISNALSGVIDTAPSTLDTLNELAAALGDDPNFATTITDLIANKLTSVPGIINQFAGSGSAAPTGWLFCDGQEVLITTYQNLYNTLTSNGTTFPYGANTNGSGGAGSTHFRIPNFKGKIPVGKDSSQTEFDVLGETGGVKSVTLTSAQSGLPAHSHANSLTGTTTFAANGHTHGAGSISAAIGATNSNIAAIGYVAGGNSGGPGVSTYTITGGIGGSQTFNHYTPTYGNTGGNSSSANVGISNVNNTAANAAEAHNNLQPYITVNYIIKT